MEIAVKKIITTVKRMEMLNNMLNVFDGIQLGGQPANEFLYILFISVIIGFIMNQILIKFCIKPEWKVEYEGSPLWTYYMCWATQFFVFPYLTYVTLKQYDFDLNKFLSTTLDECNNDMSDNGICWLRYDAFILIAYFVKDISICSGLQVIHHLTGASLVLVFLYTTYGGSGYILSILVMEDANMFWNLTTILPNFLIQLKCIFSVITFTVYTLVHIFNFYILYFMCVSLNFNTWLQRICLCVTAAGVMYLRQEVITNIMLKEMKTNCCNEKEKKEK